MIVNVDDFVNDFVKITFENIYEVDGARAKDESKWWGWELLLKQIRNDYKRSKTWKMCVDAGDSYDVDSALTTAVKISALFARDFRWSFLCKFCIQPQIRFFPSLSYSLCEQYGGLWNVSFPNDSFDPSTVSRTR